MMLLALLFSCMPTPSWAGMTLSADSISADGLELRTLSCDLSSGGFLALAGVVGGVASQKAALDACAPKGAAVELKWSWSGGKAANVSVVRSSSASANECIKAAVQKTSGADGTCTGIMMVGDPAGAAAALAALPPK